MDKCMKRSVSMALLLAVGGMGSYAPAVFAQVGPLKNTGTALCLTGNGAGVASTQACGVFANQVWSQVNIAAGTYLLSNNATGQCLNHNAAGAVFTSVCNVGVASQRWQRANVALRAARFRSSANGLFVTSTAAGSLTMAAFIASPLQIWSY